MLDKMNNNSIPPPPIFWKYTAHLLRRIGKSVHPCTLLPASFGGAETRYCLIRAASVPLLQILNVSKIRLRLICACASYLYRLFPKVFFRNIRRICVVALPKAYILVRFWQRVSAVPKHRYCLIPAASVPLLKILDVSEAAWTPLVPSCSKFFVRKTCRCTVYTDVRCTTCLRVFFICS